MEAMTGMEGRMGFGHAFRLVAAGAAALALSLTWSISSAPPASAEVQVVIFPGDVPFSRLTVLQPGQLASASGSCGQGFNGRMQGQVGVTAVGQTPWEVWDVPVDEEGFFNVTFTVPAGTPPTIESQPDSFADAFFACVDEAGQLQDFVLRGIYVGFSELDVPEISVGIAGAVEGDTGETIVSVPVTLSEPSAQTVSVRWTNFVPVVPGDELIPDEGIVSFAPGETATTIDLRFTNDLIYESTHSFWGAEWFSVTLYIPQYATLANDQGGWSQGLALLFDDEPPPTLRAIPAAVVEGDAGVTELEIRLELSHPSDNYVFGEFATVDTLSQPRPSEDYVPSVGPFGFGQLETSRTVTVPVIGDTVDEPGQLWGAEWGAITVSNLYGATVGTEPYAGLGFFLIVDDD